MGYAKQTADTYPRSCNVDEDVLLRCIEACIDCAQACTGCADACLAEDTVADLVKSIRLTADCADVCEASGRVLSRRTVYGRHAHRWVAGGLQLMRRRVRAARRDGDERLPRLRRGLPPLRSGLPRAAQRDVRVTYAGTPVDARRLTPC